MPSRRHLLVLAVAVIGAAVFLPALAGGFIWDDHTLIEENPYVHALTWWPRWLTTDFWDANAEVMRFGERMVYWRPLVTASYAADWQLGGGSPLAFHVMNTLYQAVVASLAFVVLRRWINATWPAVFAALLFAVHPTKAESVAWISGRTDILCMLFLLVVTTGIGRRLRGARRGLVLEVIGTLGAYACKEQAIVLPVFAAVEAWVAAGRPALDRKLVRPVALAVLPQAAIAVAYLAVRAIVLPIQGASPADPLGLADHAQAVLETFGRFAALVIAPHDLSVQQGLVHFKGGETVHALPYVVLGAVTIVALAATALLLRRRWPVATVGLAFFVLTILPTSNLKYSDMRTLISERFLYLPMFGIALIAGGVLAWFSAERRRRAYAVAGALVLALGMLALSRSADFRDERALWQRELALHPDSLEARMFVLRTAIADRRFASARELLAGIMEVQGAYDRIGWVDVFVAYQAAKITSRLVPDRDADSLRTLDHFLAELIAHDRPTATLAVRDVRLAIPMADRRFPEFAVKFVPQMLALRADLAGRLGDDARAVALTDEARAVCATCVSVVVMSALARARAGSYDDALQVLAGAKGHMQDRPLDGMRDNLTKARVAHDAALRSVGPAQLQAKASELATLELWGRAYAVLAPYRQQIVQAPRFAEGFAELAFRAGDRETARGVLTEIGAGAELDARERTWSLAMGWSE